MSEQVGKNYYLVVNSVNLTAWVANLQINRTGSLEEFLHATASGPIYTSRLQGKVDLSVVVEFNDDFATSGPHQTLSAIYGTTFTVVAAINGSTPSADNEVLTDTMTFADLQSGGAVASVLKKNVTFVHASGAPVFAVA